MKTFKILITLLFINLFAAKSYSQILNFDLQIRHTLLLHGDSVNINTSDSLYFTLGNYGVDSFTNTGGSTGMKFYIYADTNTNQPTPFSYTLPAYDSFFVNNSPAVLKSGDSVNLRIFIHFNSPNFGIFKDNEIVIWPAFQTHEANSNNNFSRLFIYCNGNASSDYLANNFINNTVYPNPTNNKLLLLFDSKNKQHSFEMIDINGQIIFTSEMIEAPAVNINVKQITKKSGIYFIRIKNLNTVEVKKIVVTD
ncbi:MAG: Secretion system C-terminal sorting domain [Bacteroidota bacterium]|jgi:hypothetical protein